jgi:predicted transcriptional regulator
LQDRVTQTLEITLQILQYVNEHEEEEIGTLNLVNALGYHHRTIKNHLNALEKQGFIRIEPKLNKNVVRLTDRGRCMARCLLTGE